MKSRYEICRALAVESCDPCTALTCRTAQNILDQLWRIKYIQVVVSDVTQILQAIDRGDPRAAKDLLPVVYEELRKLAEHRMAQERGNHTFQATALVHEAYLRLVDDGEGNSVKWDGRGHFFSAAAEAMRRILIDHARAKGASKRGGDARRVTLDCVSLIEIPPGDLLDLDDALSRLAEEDPAKAELVKLRFFTGLTLQQAADVMGVSRATANRYWAYARAWLFNEINQSE